MHRQRNFLLCVVLAAAVAALAVGISTGFAQTANIHGDWQSNIGVVYRIAQTGSTFGWTVVSGAGQQTATGKIDGSRVQATWTGSDPGSATGTVSSAMTG